MTTNYTKNYLKIALVLGVVLVLSLVALSQNAVGSTFATNTGTGALELKIDNQTFYNGVLQPTLSWTLKNLSPSNDKFFDFNDVKPGDTGTTTMSLHLTNGSAFICLDFSNLKNEENGINEPEGLLDNTPTGELSDELEFFAWYDDGDNAFEIGEKPLFGTATQSASYLMATTSYALADSLNGPAFPANQTKYIGITWCAGDLTVDVANAKISCDATAMGNETQTDSMSVDISIRAVSSTAQPQFTCNKPPTPPTPLEQCEIEGHKYNQDGTPLVGWNMGLMKTITHNRGVDLYDLATDVTDADGYYCLNWDGESRTLRGVSTYVNGPYDFTYSVYEKLQGGWTNVSVEKGPNFNNLSVVPGGSINNSSGYVSVQIGVQNGYIYKNAAYHVDFYNQIQQVAVKKIKPNTHTSGGGGGGGRGYAGRLLVEKTVETTDWYIKEQQISQLKKLIEQLKELLGKLKASKQA